METERVNVPAPEKAGESAMPLLNCRVHCQLQSIYILVQCQAYVRLQIIVTLYCIRIRFTLLKLEGPFMI